jgi:sugar phosphate isomerase/epimerase
MKLGFTTLACPTWPLETIIEKAVEYGYHGVDFRGLAGEMNITTLAAFTDQLDETKKRFADAGLEVPCLSTSARMFNATPTKQQASLQEVKDYANLCRRIDSPRMRVFGGSLEGTPLDQAIDQAARTLEEMAAIASPTIIAVETHDDWVASQPLAAAFAKVSSEVDNICITWDLHHPYRLAGEDPDHTYALLSPYVGYTHIKDSRLTDDGGHRLTLPGEGDVPLAYMIRQLAGGGFDGWLTVEWEKAWNPDIEDPEVALPAYARFLREMR